MKNRCQTPENTRAYRQYRNILIGVIREAKKQYIQNQLKDANPKNTWKILNDLSKGSSGKEIFPDAFKTSEGLVTGSEKIAESFNDFFYKYW